MTLNQFIEQLEAHGCKPTGGGGQISALCPGHQDHRPSLSVSQNSTGDILVHCHAGCSAEQICASLSLATKDLFAQTHTVNRQMTHSYDYRDESGKLLFQVVRFLPKDFRQRRPDPSGQDGWNWSIKGVRRVAYRLPQVLTAVGKGDVIYIAEGEKDVEALVQHGFEATCNSGGAGKWLSDHTSALSGAQAVVIIADKDEVGRRHAQAVAEQVRPVAKSVRVIELPDFGDRHVKDAHDFFAAGGTSEGLKQIWAAAPEWAAPAAAKAESTGPTSSAEKLRGVILETVLSREQWFQKSQRIGATVVDALFEIGRLYSHTELRDFESAMFFNGKTSQLHTIRSDAFLAWLSEYVAVNRADRLFRSIQAAVENAALNDPRSLAIQPEAFWAVRENAVYLSNGDGKLVKITAMNVQVFDNGTDGVLFPAGRTLKPWNADCIAVDPFKTCRIFRDARTEDPHGKDLLRAFIYSLPSNPRCKPPLCLTGEIRSGKTRMAKAISELYGLPFVAQKIEDGSEQQFWPQLNGGGIVCFDNADTRVRWFHDALASASTDGSSQRRKLYTDSDTVTLRANAWVIVTTSNPTFAADAGAADRLLVVRMRTADGDTSDSQLSDEIAANRDAALMHIAESLALALADKQPVPSGLNRRHPDFAAFAVKLGRAVLREAETVSALETAEKDKAAFCIENDQTGAALIEFLSDTGTFTGTAQELAEKLKGREPDLFYLTGRKLGKKLTSLWPHVQAACQTATRQTNRLNTTTYRFVAKEVQVMQDVEL